MFDIGFWEFALIGVIMLIVVGPEKMPAIAKTTGRYIGKIKRFITKVQADISDEIEADKLKDHLNIKDKDANIIEIFDQAKESLNEIKNDANKQ